MHQVLGNGFPLIYEPTAVPGMNKTEKSRTQGIQEDSSTLKAIYLLPYKYEIKTKVEFIELY